MNVDDNDGGEYSAEHIPNESTHLVPRNKADALDQVFELERQRIESANHRTAVMKLSVENSNASDIRQFEFAKEQLSHAREVDERNFNFEKEKFAFSKYLVAVGFLAFVTVISTLMYVSLFGESPTAERAANILRTILIGAAGWGLGQGIVAALSKIFKPVKSEVNDG